LHDLVKNFEKYSIVNIEALEKNPELEECPSFTQNKTWLSF